MARYTTVIRTLHHHKARTQGELTAWSINFGELAYAQCACVLSAGKMADRMYGHPREGALDLGKGAVSEKTPQIFRPSSPTEFVTAFSERTDVPEVRCDLTDTHTDRQTDRQTDRHDDYRNPRACAPRVNNIMQPILCITIHNNYVYVVVREAIR